MSPSAHLTILWGATPIALTSVAPGRSVGITEGGGVTRLSRGAAPALVVQMHARGATVWRPRRAARGGAHRRWLPTGADVQIAIAAPSGAPVYRRRVEWEPAPLVLRIAVTAEEPRPRPRPSISARALGAAASVVATHAVGLSLAWHAMPPLAPLDPAVFASEADVSSYTYRVEAIPDEAYRDAPYEDRFGAATEVCAPLDEPPIGRSLAVQGPSDNPDPHLARDYQPFGARSHDWWFGPPFGPMVADDVAPTSPWGRDDALGVAPFSATGTARGELLHPMAATCFGASPARWSCSGADEPPASPTVESSRLPGIGEPEVPTPKQRRRSPSAHVEVGPVRLAANVPRWLFVSSVRAAVDEARACYRRALADDPTLTGRFDAVLKVRGDAVSVEIAKSGDVARSPALQCCVEHAHDDMVTALPAGTRATALYSITFTR